MTLSTRVATLEKDVAALRIRMDNADVDRDDIRREISGLRAETRGWARLAVRADQKTDTAIDLMQLIYADVRQAKETLAEHGAMLAEHGAMLREILAKLDGRRS